MIVVVAGVNQFQGAMEEEEGYTNSQEWCSQQEGRFQKLYQDCGRQIVLIDNRSNNENKRKQLNFEEIASRIFAVESHKWSILSFKLLICLLFIISCCHSTPVPRHLCHPGTYVHTTRNNKNICQPCPDGTFMPDSLHTHKTCYSCTQIRDQNLEVLKTECSRTHDARILCKPGYYRRRARNVREVDRCEKCYECEHPTLPCQDYHDTVCCGHTNYDAVLNKDRVYECKERPVLCDPGRFINPETEECIPCPPGTFMSEVQHDNKACIPCKTVSDLGAHETILQACTSTQQTNIGCEDGYFRNSSGSFSDEVRCLPCQKCEYQGRECDMYHDTVCCDHPDMMVVNTSSGYQCMHYPSSGSQIDESLQRDICQGDGNKERYTQVCGENEYFNFISKDSILCVPCERGTYMDKSNHTERVCKNCSQIQGSHASTSCQVLTVDVDKAETDLARNVFISVIVVLSVLLAGMLYYIKRLRKCRTMKLSGIAAHKDKPMSNSGRNIKLGLFNSQEFNENTGMIDMRNKERINEELQQITRDSHDSGFSEPCEIGTYMDKRNHTEQTRQFEKQRVWQ